MMPAPFPITQCPYQHPSHTLLYQPNAAKAEHVSYPSHTAPVSMTSRPPKFLLSPTTNPLLHWDNVDTVLLDMDGTLLDLHFDNYFWQHYLLVRYSQQHRLPFLQVQQELQVLFKQHQGTLNWYCLDFWQRQLQLDIMRLKQEVAHLIKLRPFVIEFLSSLKRLNKRVVLITNAHPKILEFKMQHIQLQTYFDQMISSHTLGYPKEDARFWEKLQTVENFNRMTTLFIDDSLPILYAATNFGIRYVFGVAQPDSHKIAYAQQPNLVLLNCFCQITPFMFE